MTARPGQNPDSKVPGPTGSHPAMAMHILVLGRAREPRQQVCASRARGLALRAAGRAERQGALGTRSRVFQTSFSTLIGVVQSAKWTSQFLF